MPNHLNKAEAAIRPYGPFLSLLVANEPVLAEIAGDVC